MYKLIGLVVLKVTSSNIRFCSNTSSQKANEGEHSNAQNNKPALDKFIKECEQLSKAANKPNSSLIKKLFSYPTLNIIPQLPVYISGIYMCVKYFSLKKQAKNSLTEVVKFIDYKKNIPIKLLISLALGIPIGLITNSINKNNKEKHNQEAQKIINDFNKKNKTDIKLTVQSLGVLIAAQMDPASGKINMDDRFVEDSLYAKSHMQPFLKHELVHAKQYMLMASSEGGIEKLNYIFMKKIAKLLDANGRKEVVDMYNEIQNGVNDKYKNATVDRMGYKINMIDYITALHKLISEPNTQPKDLPMIINKDFYEQIKAKKGKLTDAEEKKAQAYFKAYEEYPAQVGFLQIFNPKSTYRQNLMEKEAYKMNPWYTY